MTTTTTVRSLHLSAFIAYPLVITSVNLGSSPLYPLSLAPLPRAVAALCEQCLPVLQAHLDRPPYACMNGLQATTPTTPPTLTTSPGRAMMRTWSLWSTSRWV